MVYKEITEDDKKRITNCDKFCKEVVSFIKYECAREYNNGEQFTEADFKAIENHVVFRNCVYDVQNDRKLPFSSELPYTFGLAVDYEERDKKAEMWERILSDATNGDKESIEMIKVCIAYLTVPNLSAKSLLVLAYAKDSGKTTVGRVCANMYDGIRAEVIDPDKLSGRFAYERASTTVLYYCLDMNTDKMKPQVVAELKKLTGEKMLRSEGKYQSMKTVPIRFKIMLATNTGLYLDEKISQDGAFYRRVVVLPFIVSQDKDMLMNDMYGKLMEELPIFLSKCVRRMRKYIKYDGGIVLPESRVSRMIKQSWMRAASLVGEFAESQLSITRVQEDKIPKEDIYLAYKRYAASKIAEGFKCRIVDKNECIQEILRRADGGVEAKKARITSKDNKNPVPCLVGVTWKKDD